MLSSYKIERIREKYPDILTDDGCHVSLWSIGSYINMINSNNVSSADLQALKLQDFKKDLSWILGDIKKDRMKKLERLNNL